MVWSRATCAREVSLEPVDHGSEAAGPSDADRRVEEILSVLSEAGRLRALAESGLADVADPIMDGFAERVRERLGVPVALVSLVSPDEQTFPGMAGLPDPWATQRSTPLTHSFCQYVVAAAEPLVIADARVDPLLSTNLAVADLGVVAYAGWPLTDDDGAVLGSLCAIDVRPRVWTRAELAALEEIGQACSTELRLRLARVVAARERGRRDELEAALRRSYERSQALLAASQAFTDTVTVADVRRRVSELVSSVLEPAYVGLLVFDDTGRLRRVPDDRVTSVIEHQPGWTTHDLDERIPVAVAVREQRMVVHEDRPHFGAAGYDDRAWEALRELGLHAVAAVPLPGPDGPLGALAFGWTAPRRFDPTDLVALTTITGYAARALERAQRLQSRTGVAAQMQRAMLTTLPEVPGLSVVARYAPADAREFVGGDWYDLVALPDRSVLALSVGDVVGHDVAAATVMGQIRSMLRQAGWDHPGSPSYTLTAFENACNGVGLNAMGTTVLAHLRRRSAGRWSMTWTNAGHPPPILLVPGGRPVLLHGHDIAFGFSGPREEPGWEPPPRHDHRCDLEPGSTVVLYTDGLVERRGDDLDNGTARLLDLLDAQRDLPPRELVDAAVDTLGAGSADDIVAVVARVSDDTA